MPSADKSMGPDSIADLSRPSQHKPRHVELPDHDSTRRLGALLAHQIAPGFVIFLSGDLGAGKTTLVQGFMAALGETGRVRSPTYTLVETYARAGLKINHFDLYRFTSATDWHDAGLADLIDPSAISLIEWPEMAANALPAADLTVRLDRAPGGRLASLFAASQTGQSYLDRLSLDLGTAQVAPQQTVADGCAGGDKNDAPASGPQ